MSKDLSDDRQAIAFQDLPLQRAPVNQTRVERDFYPTGEPEAILSLLHADGERIRQSGTVWEPACGRGDMVRQIRGHGLPCCASDIHDYGCPDSWVGDYFSCLRPRGKAIITNPPYNLITAKDGHGRWLRHALEMPDWDYMALLLSWEWPAARANGLGELLDANPFSYCYLMRWKLDFTGEKSPKHRNAWFVWDRNWVGESAFRLMDRVDPRQGTLTI
jgi:hypothetical protein